MTEEIKTAATAVDITVFISDSESRIENQLNRLTKDVDDPIMLVSWDISTKLIFDEHGFLDNPESDITALLLSKAEDSTKEEQQNKSDEMAALFQTFIKKLRDNLVAVQLTTNTPISGVSYIAVPRYGMGKHSGILAKWTMKTAVSNCT